MSFLHILLFSWPRAKNSIRGLTSAGHLIYQTNPSESPFHVKVLFITDKDGFMFDCINLCADKQMIQISLPWWPSFAFHPPLNLLILNFINNYSFFSLILIQKIMFLWRWMSVSCWEPLPSDDSPFRVRGRGTSAVYFVYLIWIY